jgi:uncharacterized protein YegL
MAKIIDAAVFKDNSSQRTPCVVVVDGSGSMDGGPINNLNEALKAFEAALKEDDEASVRVQVQIIRLGDDDEANVLTDWVDAIDFVAPTVEANGTTPLGKAVDLAMSEIQTQKERYKQNAIPYTRPWLFVFTDGEPTDDWQDVAERCKLEQAQKRFVLFPIAVGETAPTGVLQAFCGPERKVLRTGDVKFREMFLWLAASLAATSRSVPGQQVALPDPSSWLNVQA